MSEPTPVMGDDDRQRACELSLQGVRVPPTVPGHSQLRFLGRGAFGEVWLAVEDNTARQVAIKFYAHRDAPDWPQLSREVEKLRFLFNDRHVVQLLRVGWEAEPPYFIMEYMEQGSLEERLERDGPMPAATAVEFFRDVATGLLHAHRKGILHCDLKPDNILLDHDSRPRLADFGQARLPHENVPALGTLFYMAPEQADLKAHPDPRWDVYALGAVLYRMLTGTLPYRTDESVTALSRGTSLFARLDQYRQLLQTSPVPSAHRKVSGVDRALAEIVERCLALDPAARFPTVQAVIAALDARALRRARRSLLVLGGVGPALLLMVMAFIGWRVLGTAVSESHDAVVSRARESNHFAARFVAEQFALDVDRRWRILEFQANDVAMHRLLKERDQSGAGSAERQRAQAKLDDWIAFQHKRFNLQFRAGTQTRSWFLLDRTGVLIAHSPRNERFLDLNWAHRDLFHGLGQDFDPKTFDPRKASPIRKRYRSVAFRSQVSNSLMTALAVPVRAPDSGKEPIGVLCMTVELGAFADFLGSDDQFAVLMDTRTDAVEGRPGLILEHREFDKQKLPPGHEGYYVASDLLERAKRLARQRLERPPQEPDGTGTPVNGDHPDDVPDFVDDYVDPVPSLEPGRHLNRWLATIEPVMIVRGQTQERIDTGWAVIVQERYQKVTSPVTALHRDLLHIGAVGLALVSLVVMALWGFVLLVLNDKAREKVTRLLRRYAGLMPERSFTPTVIAPARPAGPEKTQEATIAWEGLDPESLKKTDRLGSGPPG